MSITRRRIPKKTELPSTIRLREQYLASDLAKQRDETEKLRLYNHNKFLRDREHYDRRKGRKEQDEYHKAEIIAYNQKKRLQKENRDKRTLERRREKEEKRLEEISRREIQEDNARNGRNIREETYCVHCKKKTGNKDIEIVKRKISGQARLSSVCVICNHKKSSFLKTKDKSGGSIGII